MAKPAPSGTQTTTTFQVGTYNPASDTWSQVIDLNDQATIWLLQGYPQMPQPDKTRVASSNVRTPGESIQRVQYKNRHIKVAITIRGNAAQTIVNTVHTLIAAINNPPYTLRIALPKTTSYSYADVQDCKHDLPTDPLRLQQLAIVKATMDFECYPYLRGDRVVLQNLAVNPGFEAPSGPAVNVFADAFANVTAYAVQAGGSPTTGPSNTFVDAVIANIGANLLRYYRLGLADDATHAYDIAGTAQTGTPTASPTQQVAGGLSGDTDTCYTFASALSQYVDLPTTGLPTGNSPISFGGRVKFPSNPAGAQYFCTYGSGAGGNHNYIGAFLNGSGGIAGDVGAATVTSGAQTTATWHDWAVTWDGTTLRFYVDGASVGTPATPGNQTIPTSSLKFRIAATANTAASGFYNGQLDEVWVANTAVGATAIANIHTAALSGASGTVSNAASFPAASRVSFGSPNWSTLNTWAVRFRYATSQAGTYYLHYTDASNNLACQVASGANGFKLVHTIAGVATTVAQATVPLQHEAWYWLQLSQFPTLALQGNAPYLQAVLAYDSAGVVGTTIATLGTRAQDAVTALSGKPQIAASGAALILGGLSSGTGQSVGLFGPGAWTFQTAGTGPAFGAWDLTAANTYPSGPVTSVAAARIDANAAGTLDAKWRLYTGGTPAGTWAIPVSAAGDTLFAGVNVKSSALGNGATLKLEYTEYDASGASLRTGTLQTVTIASLVQAAYAAAGAYTLSGTWTTGANCAFVDVAVHVADTSAANSANAIVWLDNVQVYDQTSTGQTAMPYCELRFSQSPAQVVVSGLVGDAPANAILAFGTYLAAWTGGSTNMLTFGLGVRAQAAADCVLVGGAQTGLVTDAMVLDATAYGGCTLKLATSNETPVLIAPKVNALLGTYHLFARAQTQEAGTLSKVTVAPFYGSQSAAGAGYDGIAGASTSPFTVVSTWTSCDVGQMSVPFNARGGAMNLASMYANVAAQFADSNGSPGATLLNYLFLLPIDKSFVYGAVQPTGTGEQFWIEGQYLWAYSDPTPNPNAAVPSVVSWAYSVETAALSNLAHVADGPGAYTTTTGTINTNPTADPYLVLDPAKSTTLAAGVNQLGAILTDQAAKIYPLFVDLAYSPNYLYPR